MDHAPRIHTVQTTGAHPLERAYHKVRGHPPGLARRRRDRRLRSKARREPAVELHVAVGERAEKRRRRDPRRRDLRLAGGRAGHARYRRRAGRRDGGAARRGPPAGSRRGFQRLGDRIRRPRRARRVARPPARCARTSAWRFCSPGSSAERRWPGPDSPASAPAVVLRGATVVVALDPPEVVCSDLVIAGGRGPGARRRHPRRPCRRDCTGTLIVPGNVCAHHHLYSALSRGMPYALAPPRGLHGDPPADLVAARPRPRRGIGARLRGPGRARRPPRRDDDDRRPPRLAECDRRLARRHRRRARQAGRALGALLRGDGPRRPGARRGGPRGEPALPAAAISASPAGWWARTPRSHCRTRPSRRALREAADAGVGVHIHVAEDEVDERDCVGRCSERVAGRLAAAGVLTERALLAHCVHVDEAEARLVESSGATVACNPRSQHEQRRRPLAVQPPDGARSRSGPTASAATCWPNRRRASSGAKEADLGTAPEWPLVRLAEGARLVGTGVRRAAARYARARARRRTSACSPMRRRRRSGRQTSPGTGCSASPRGGSATFTWRASSSSKRAARPGSTSPGSPPTRSGTTERLWRRLEETPAHTYDPRRREER